MRRTVALAISGLAVTCLAGGVCFYFSTHLQSAQSLQTIVITEAAPPVDSSAPAPSPNAKPAAVRPGIPPRQLAALLTGLHSDDAGARREAIGSIRALSLANPKNLALALPQLAGPLLDAHLFDDVEKFSALAIKERPFDVAVVQTAQRSLVLSYIAQENFPEALKEAKSYYNVVSLVGTAEAVDLLAQILSKTGDASVVGRFKAEQSAGIHRAATPAAPSILDPTPAADIAQSVLSSIHVDAAPYETALSALEGNLGSKGYSVTNLIGQGNLLLLADRPSEAKSAFESACRAAGSKPKDIRESLEGVARATRSIDGNVANANELIQSLHDTAQANASNLLGQVSPNAADIVAAAVNTPLATVVVAPPLEVERQRAETAIDNSAPINITSGFEESTPITVQRLSPTHFRVTTASPQGSTNWFMFRVSGAKGKTIRIDMVDPADAYKWWSLNPVYSSVENLGDLASFNSAPPVDGSKSTTAWNGAQLPDTRGQSWHFIENAWQERLDSLSFVQHFVSDTAYVAMRVPYTPAYNDAYLESIASNPSVHLAEIGISPQGRHLRAIEITEGGDPKIKPCIFIYAREHANEQDTSWVVQGAIEFLLSSNAEAVEIRQRSTLLAMPMLDPDGAAASLYHRITDSFSVNRSSPESKLIAQWLQQRIDNNHRLDVVLNLHNLQSADGPHIYCPFMSFHFANHSILPALHERMMAEMTAAGFGVDAKPRSQGMMGGRFSEWAGQFYGALPLAYEINSQSPSRHLSPNDLRRMGEVMVRASASFLQSNPGKSQLANGSAALRRRRLKVATYGYPRTDGADPFLAELRFRLGIGSDQKPENVELIR